MIRQPMLRLRVVGRLTIGLLGVATALLLAPVAGAQPDVEANDAITAAWQASGGDTGPLGPTSGDVYPAGVGFAQDFALGKVFFTPATGAHLMQGAILDKYEALGGPADSDLGFPTIDEGPGRAPGSVNSTFSAPDNPVIFWTPDTGARVVRGPINAAWDRLGGSTGVLGVPAEDETYDESVVSQKFTGGQVSYDSRTKSFTTDPADLAGQLADLSPPEDPVAAIDAARRAAGGPLGPLGAPEGEPYKIGSDGLGQDFVNGKIFYSPDTGANVVTGQVLTKYESVGGPQGDLGFPITGEVDGGIAPASRMSSFAAAHKPVIFWTPDDGAMIVRGAMNAAWAKLGGATGKLGAPVSDQSQSGEQITQKFSGGAITYDTAAKKFTTEPADLAAQLAGLEVPGQRVGQAPPAAAPGAETGAGTGFRWTWWWLLAIVPVLLAAGVVALIVARNRGRGDDDLFGQPYRDADVDEQDDDQPVSTSGAGDEGREDTLFGERYAREGLGSLASAAASTSAGPEPGYATGRLDFWETSARTTESAGAPDLAQDDPDAVDTAPTRVPMGTEMTIEEPAERELEALPEPDFEPDAPFDVELLDEPDRESTQMEHPEPAAAVEPDAVTDTGRHARIELDEPAPMGTALHLPLDEPGASPDGYPVKADTKSGLYWAPDSPGYGGAPAEIWFASEDIARTNGFVRGA